MLQDTEVRSPIVVPPSNVEHELAITLTSEISEGVHNLTGGKRWQVDRELKRLKDIADRDSSPVAAYNLLLFRKYAVIADQIQERNESLEEEMASYSEPAIATRHRDSDDESEPAAVISGSNALKSKLFWLRVMAGVFSFISFVIMSNLYSIDRMTYSIEDYFPLPVGVEMH